ncbi:MAG: helix-turn-helix transcriptional regulator [Oscillospiraceae bacterium]|nr:helix-turn-helix transcriptional regulator [Oscillospiraceae bacterium]
MDERIRNRIKDLRKNKILSQQKVADYVGCSQRTYSGYERGEFEVPTDIVVKLAELHDTTTDYILGVNNKKVVFVDGLTDKQIETVKLLISDLISGNNAKNQIN